MTGFYSRKGDDGYTAILGKDRVPKYDDQPEAFGTVDEVSAGIGIVRAMLKDTAEAELLLTVQGDLHYAMGELAASIENQALFRKIDAPRVTWLEEMVQRYEDQVELPRAFVTAGDSLPAAFINQARTIVRRAERRVAYLYHQERISNVELLRYLNRLSSLLYVLGLWVTKQSGVDDISLTGKFRR